MTLGLAIRTDSGILVGADSGVSDKDGTYPERSRKLWSTPFGALTGCGDLNELQRAGDLWTQYGPEHLIIYLRDHSRRPEIELDLMLVSYKRIRLVSWDGAVFDAPQRCVAVGSGRNAALGYMAAAGQALSWGRRAPKDEALRAVRQCFRAVSKIDSWVKGPFKVVLV